jgi:hypothetical protein
MTTAMTISPTFREPQLPGQIVVIGSNFGNGLETGNYTNGNSGKFSVSERRKSKRIFQ